MGKDFHFPFYFAEFLASTDLWTNEQTGGHIRVLCHQADKGHLTEQAIINRIGLPIWDSIRERYRQDHAGLWFHPKLDKILKEREKYVKNRLMNLHMGSHMGSHVGSHAKDSNKSKDKGKSSEGLIDKDIKALEDFDLEVKTQALENFGIERVDGKDE